MADPAHIGSLDELAANPALAAALSAAERSRLLARAASALAALSAVDAPADVAHDDAPPRPAFGQLLTVDEVAEILGFARGYVYELVRGGQIRAVHHGKYWRVATSAVEDFIREHEHGAGLDTTLNNMLSKIREAGSRKARPKSARTQSGRASGPARGAFDDGEPVGTRNRENPAGNCATHQDLDR